MQQTQDIARFPFKDFNGRAAFCRLRVWEEAGKPPIVMATEVEGNAGMSVTNAAERIAMQAYQMLERPEGGMMFIENYPEKEDKRLARWEESFDAVTFTATARGLVDPNWQHMTREEVEQLIGQPVGE